MGLAQLYSSAVSGGWTLPQVGILVYYLGQGLVSPCQGSWGRGSLTLIPRAAMPIFANSPVG